jgi:hypothetical protein
MNSIALQIGQIGHATEFLHTPRAVRTNVGGGQSPFMPPTVAPIERQPTSGMGALAVNRTRRSCTSRRRAVQTGRGFR